MAKEIRIIKNDGQPDQVQVKQKNVSLGSRLIPVAKRNKRKVVPNTPL